MFLITSIAMLRERTSGTLERLMSLPIAKADILFGYGIAFGALAAAAGGRSSASSASSRSGSRRPTAPGWSGCWRSPTRSSAWPSASSLSAFATTEFQAVQFMPAVVLPQLILCGLFVARDEMAGFLHAISWLMPLTYAYDALARATGAERARTGRSPATSSSSSASRSPRWAWGR